MQEKLTRIGVFYDGNYFLKVSNYYAYGHTRNKRISISGLHDFVVNQVADEESIDPRLCRIVDAHYFRGRLNAADASQRGDTLYNDRVFDDILMSEGVTTHYLPVRQSYDGYKQEKGIDVWLALEAYELALYKKFNVIVLIASDGDYVPLVRKLNTLGIRVMVMGWDFDYTNDNGQRHVTRTSQELLEEVTYPIQMAQIIDDRVRRNDALINNLFVQNEVKRQHANHSANGANGVNGTHGTNGVNGVASVGAYPMPESDSGEIMTLKNGFGFIKYPPNNLFFHYSSLIETDFNELNVGDIVTFNIEKNSEGQDIAKDVRMMSYNRI